MRTLSRPAGFLCVPLGAIALLALPPSPAQAAHHHKHATHGPRAATAGPPGTGRVDGPPTPRSLAGPGSGTAAGDLGASGQVDPLSGLGIRNPVCDEIAQIRDRQTRWACEASGAPEGEYPASNYGFDIFISTGITHPVGDITYGFATVLNGIWLGLIFVLRLIFALLGLAFGLNPFADGQTMAQLSAALGRIYGRVTDPWLSTAVVCAGIWFSYKGLLRREAPAAIAGTLAAVAMLIVGLWVIHQPAASIGRLAALADRAALTVISAPQSGSAARPEGSYAEAMSGAWSRLVEVPFAGLDFSDVSWALGTPPAEAVQRADEKFCEDDGALAVLALFAHYGSVQAKEACATLARRRYGSPRRVIDLYLRSSPGSPARQALWDYFDGEERYKAKVAAQGGDGVLTRLSMLALFALGLLGAMLLLGWLAIRLFTQAAVAFVLLLAAPLALFFPLLGDSGRRAFKTWGLTLIGATLAKVIYAAFLSVVLLGIEILGGSGASPATGFLLSSAFAWAVFLKRAEIVGWLSIGEPDRQAHHGSAPTLAALTIGRRLSRTTTGAGGGALKGGWHRGAEWRRERRAERGEATRASARDSLHGRARALADSRHADARHTVERFESRYGRPRRSERRGGEGRREEARGGEGRRARAGESGDARRAGDGDRERPAAAAAHRPSDHERARYERARELLARADRGERRGAGRWSERDLERFGAADAELLRGSRDPADHVHRIGISRAEFEALPEPERQRAAERIEGERKRDLRRLEVSSEPPGRIAGRPRLAAEGARQRIEGSAARREHLRRLRRERRAGRAPLRRNLSRGA
jgi:hypothetical protein